MIQESTFYGCKGRELFYRYAAPEDPKAILVVLHGYGEHSGRYLHVIEAFAARGYAVYVPDHRGHGRNIRVFADIEGRNIIREDVNILTQTVQQFHPGIPTILLGHSMGGMFALYQLLGYQSRYDAAIVTGPAILLPKGISPLMKAAASVVAALVPNLPVQDIDLSEVTRNMEMREQDKNDPLQYRGKARARTGNEIIRTQEEIHRRLEEITLPILVMHGGDDKVIDPAAAEIVYSKVGSSDKTKKIWPGLFHEILNEPERNEVFSFVFDWLEARTPK